MTQGTFCLDFVGDLDHDPDLGFLDFCDKREFVVR